MGRSRLFLVFLSSVALGGCFPGFGDSGRDGAPRLVTDELKPLAVGTTKRIQLRIGCGSPSGSYQQCEDVGLVRVDVAATSDPSIIAVDEVVVNEAPAPSWPSTGTIRLRALAEGETRLDLQVVDSEGKTHTIEALLRARQAASVALSPSCDADLGLSLPPPPYLVRTQQLISFSFQLLAADGERLWGEGLVPIDAGPLELVAATDWKLDYMTPMTAEVFTISSPLEPALQVPMQIYPPLGAGLGIELVPAGETSLPFTSSPTAAGFEVVYTYDGRQVCVGDVYPITIASPMDDVCTFTADGREDKQYLQVKSPGQDVAVHGFGEGFCHVVAGFGVDNFVQIAELLLRFTLPPLAEAGGAWTWEHPLPQANPLTAVHGAGADLFAAGSRGTILHLSGGAWVAEDTGTHESLSDVWAEGGGEAWAVGGAGLVLRRDGSKWAPVPSGTTRNLYAVWSGGGEAWAVGESGTILRWDGAVWSPTPSGTSVPLSGVAGDGAGSVWAVGEGGTILRWDGSGWTNSPSGTSNPLRDIFVTSATDIWVVGPFASILHWDGTGWTPAATALTASVTAVDASNGGDLWMVGNDGRGLSQRWNGTAWVAAPPVQRTPFYDVFTAPGGDTWAVGGGGGIYRFDGSAWQEVSIDTSHGLTLRDMWGASEDEMWAVGSEQDPPMPTLGPPRGVIYRRAAGAWTRHLTLDQALHAVWGSAADDVWAAGDSGALLHWNGSDWTAIESDTDAPIHDLWGTGADDVWAAAGAGTVLHYDGRAWSASKVVSGDDAPALRGIGGTGPDDVWVVGDNRWSGFTRLWTVYRWNGSSWQLREPPGGAREVWSVWGSEASGVWLAGGQSAIFHHAGGDWSNTATPHRAFYEDVWGTGPSDVWVTAPHALSVAGPLRWNGASWEDTRAPAPPHEIFGLPSGPVWLLGEHGAILRYSR